MVIIIPPPSAVVTLIIWSPIIFLGFLFVMYPIGLLIVWAAAGMRWVFGRLPEKWRRRGIALSKIKMTGWRWMLALILLEFGILVLSVVLQSGGV